MIILNQEQIKQKIKRMAIEIYERHSDEKKIFLAGINTKGYEIAKLLSLQISELSPIQCELLHIHLNPAQPTEHPISLNVDSSLLRNKSVIITDDVANTGRTLFYSFKTIMDIVPKKLEVAVLIERTHKGFPIHVDFVGMKLATTLKDNIEVALDSANDWKVSLN